jgi:hypothetical protein
VIGNTNQTIIVTETIDHSGDLDAEGARALTDRIRSGVEWLWKFLLEAHERKAWLALGYHSWGEYIDTEFDMSRNHAYQLIYQAQTIRAIESVLPIDISPVQSGPIVGVRNAQVVKRNLDDVLLSIGERAQGVDDPAVVASIVREEISREVAKKHPPQPRGPQTTRWPDDLSSTSKFVKHHVRQVVECVTRCKCTECAKSFTAMRRSARLEQVMSPRDRLEQAFANGLSVAEAAEKCNVAEAVAHRVWRQMEKAAS